MLKCVYVRGIELGNVEEYGVKKKVIGKMYNMVSEFGVTQTMVGLASKQCWYAWRGRSTIGMALVQ